MQTLPAAPTQPRPSSTPSPATVPFAGDLAVHGDAVAVVADGAAVSYRDLAARVADLAGRIGMAGDAAGRRLVMVPGRNDVDALLAYLGALAAGHVVLLVPGDNAAAAAALTDAYDPDLVVRSGTSVERRREGTVHDLHPDLALLLSTSGSTGSPKLVRLSRENLRSNAESIAQYLGIRPGDRAATTLPMHYCYGLSVVHSHLRRGATLVLTDRSVVDPCFWREVREQRVTSFAGVPHTFDLLERVGFADMDLPHLRYVTQAGGRLAPSTVRRFAALGQRQGWDLFVMYGATEATSRMAYLPPEAAWAHPEAIGVPIPGGELFLVPADDHPDPGVGELHYRGPNVMLGYAQRPADLALGRETDVLATGDLARRTPEGFFEVVGRRSRFVKVFGVRVDLARCEELLAGLGLTTCCAGDDGALVVAVEGAPDTRLVRTLAAGTLGLPPTAVRVVAVDAVPRLPTGKPDYRAVTELGREAAPADGQAAAVPAPATTGIHAGGAVDAEAVRALYAELLDRPDAGLDDTFVGLGGDSLSYVEMSIRLEELLGDLPAGWHVTPIRDLASARPRRRTRLPRLGRALETGVALRALAIVLIVATHAGLLDVKGTAHVLVAVAGYNFARFQLTPAPRWERLRHQAASVARVAVPSMVWIGGAYLLTDRYGWQNVVLLNVVLGPDRWTPAWDYWFVEVLVIVLVSVAALTAVPWVDTAERRFPFAVAAGLVALGLVWRFELVAFDLLHTKPVFWLFALGWATARASTAWQRLAVSAVAVATVPGFFADPRRDGLILAGVLLLVWVPSLRCPGWLNRAAGVLASASLYVYLTHWQVYPHLEDVSPALAVVASLAVGIAYGRLATAATGWRPPLRRSTDRPAPSR